MNIGSFVCIFTPLYFPIFPRVNFITMLNETISVPAGSGQKLPASLQTIIEKLQAEDQLNPARTRRIILEAGVQASDLMPWADFDHPVEDSYGRKLVYEADNFEIMVMSWLPGDFSAIHDHGATQWGCVQVFGPAEHATFREEEGQLITLSRSTMQTGQAIGVSHSLVHQMGNATADQRYLSLHVYGNYGTGGDVTADARIFNLETGNIDRVDGGVFFGLPKGEIKRVEPGLKGDFPTRLRHTVELVRRLRKMQAAGKLVDEKRLQRAIDALFDVRQRVQLLNELEKVMDENGHCTNSVYWRIINRELREAAQLQDEILAERQQKDAFHQYAELYDALIGEPCLQNFMAGYLKFFSKKVPFDFTGKDIISLGCGTGLVEEFMIDELRADRDKLFGMDISQAMVQVATQRIEAETGDVLTLDPAVKLWDMAYSGLNVFHYINHQQLREAVERTAGIIKPGGFFLGDFITPDHIRWYPNRMLSEDQQIVSLRTPQLIEDHGAMFQLSEITNVSFLDDRMRITYAGKHRRFLPPLHRVRSYFEQFFTKVELYDARSLQLIPEFADSCSSTRYVVLAQR